MLLEIDILNFDLDLIHYYKSLQLYNKMYNFIRIYTNIQLYIFS